MKTIKQETTIKNIIRQAISVQFNFIDKKAGGEYFVFLDEKPMLVIIHRACFGFYPWYKVYHPTYGVWTGSIQKTIGNPSRVGNYPDDNFWKEYLSENEFLDENGISINETPDDMRNGKIFYGRKKE
jgi:hypothetical protein